MEKWLDNMLGGKVEKEAAYSQGTDAADHLERKLAASNWIESVQALDVDAVEAEYQARLAAEAKLLGKTAAYEKGETPKETIEKDYARDVKILSDYALAEILAELRCSKAQNTQEMFAEAKEKARKEVSSSREKAEKALLELTPDHTMLDWQKAFDRFSKDAKPEEVKEKDLYKPEVPEKAYDMDSPKEDKFKMPTKEEMVPEGNGREADKCKEVTKEASVKTADKVKNNPADDKGNLAMPEGKKSAGDKPVESVEESTLLSSPKEIGDKDDQAMEGNSPEKGDKAKDIESVNKEAARKCPDCTGTMDDHDSGCRNTSKEMRDGYIANKEALYQPKTGEPCSCKPGIARDNCPSCEGTGQKVDFKKIREMPLEEKKADGPSASEICPTCKGHAGKEDWVNCQTCKPLPEETKAPLSPLEREQLATDRCPICSGEGKDLANGMSDSIACQACGITYAPSEIKACASKAETIKKVAELSKKSEVSSPWVVIKDESGQDVIARVTPDLKKESEEKKDEEIQK
jgi:hypothetical protein